MINSHLAYLWSTSASQNDISRLQIAQNHAIRKIFAHEYYNNALSTSDIMNKYKILNVRQLIQQSMAIMAYKIDNTLMKSNHTFNDQPIHEHSTRFRSLPRLISARTNVGIKSVFRSCTEQYLKIPLSIRSARSEEYKKNPD